MLHAEHHAPSVRLLQHGNETCGRVSLLCLMNEASTVHFIDSTIVRAHQHAAEAKKAGRKTKDLDEAEAD